MLVICVCALVCGIDDLVGIEAWPMSRLTGCGAFFGWRTVFRHTIPWGECLACLTGKRSRRAFGAGSVTFSRPWAEGDVVAVDGKSSRRSRQAGQQALHLVSAFAAHAGLVLGQEACTEKSNELTAIPVLLETLMLKGGIVTIDAMGTHSTIAQAIRDKEADYVLTGKNNQPRLAESIATFFAIGQAEHWKNVIHSYAESVEKDHGRIEVRRCWAFDGLDCLADPQQWPDLTMFASSSRSARSTENELRTALLYRQYCPGCRDTAQNRTDALEHRKPPPLVP
jgi:predicted transposase YbfD/YdcC